MAKRLYDHHELNFNRADDESSPEFGVSHNNRMKLVRDMAVSLPEDMVNAIKVMAIHNHEKDLMLPTMTHFLLWSGSQKNIPLFELSSHFFQPNWLDAGLVSFQQFDHTNYEYIRQLPAVVRYVLFEHAMRPKRYCTVDITSTLMESCRDNPSKVYYPYQIWHILPSFHSIGDYIGGRSADDINQDKARWEGYWSNQLNSRVHRVEEFVRELESVLRRSKRHLIFFDGRRVVFLDKIWVEPEEVDTSRLGTQDCERLLRQFRDDPESLDLTEFSRIQKPKAESPMLL